MSSTVKITNIELNGIFSAFQALFNYDTRGTDTNKLYNYYNKNLRDLVKSAAESQKSVMESYGGVQQQDGSFVFGKMTDAAQKKLQKELDDLMALEHEVEKYPDTLEAIMNRAHGKKSLEVAVLFTLEPIFKEPEGESTKAKPKPKAKSK